MADTGASPRPMARIEHTVQRGSRRWEWLYLALFLSHPFVLTLMLSGTPDAENSAVSEAAAWNLGTNLLVAVGVGALAGPLWMFLYLSPDTSLRLLYTGQLAAAVLLTVLAVSLLVSGSALQLVIGVGILVMVAADWAWTMRTRSRMKFLDVMLGVVTGGLRRLPQLLVVAGVHIIVQAAYLVWWTLQVVFALRAGYSPFGTSLIMALLLVCLRWTQGYFSLNLACITAGSFARHLVSQAQDRGVVLSLEGAEGLAPVASRDWAALETRDDERYEASLREAGLAGTDAAEGGRRGDAEAGVRVEEERGDGLRDDRHAVALDPASLQRSPMVFFYDVTVKSTGTIALGSLAALISPPLWSLLPPLRWLEKRGGVWLAPRVRAVLALIRRILRNSHRYGALNVAMHGLHWSEAARSSWYVFELRGVEAIAAADPTHRLLLFGSYVGGSILALASGISLHPEVAHWLLIAIILFWIGFISVSLPQTLIGASVDALLATFAASPTVLSQTHPILYHRFVRIAELRHHARATAIAALAAPTTTSQKPSVDDDAPDTSGPGGILSSADIDALLDDAAWDDEEEG